MRGIIPSMKLVTDDRCRIQSRELFKPNTPYRAERTADGRIEFIELVDKTEEVPEVKAIRTKEGYVMFPPGQRPSRETLRASIREDRDIYQSGDRSMRPRRRR